MLATGAKVTPMTKFPNLPKTATRPLTQKQGAVVTKLAKNDLTRWAQDHQSSHLDNSAKSYKDLRGSDANTKKFSQLALRAGGAKLDSKSKKDLQADIATLNLGKEPAPIPVIDARHTEGIMKTAAKRSQGLGSWIKGAGITAARNAENAGQSLSRKSFATAVQNLFDPKTNSGKQVDAGSKAFVLKRLDDVFPPNAPFEPLSPWQP